MCGIAGWVGDPAGAEDRVRRAVGLLDHRGPDQSGVQRFDECVLGHNRLRIVDLSPLGDQPMANEDGTVQLVYNGELYNHAELRADLVARGHRFRSATDTEVLVHLYEEHGDRLVEHLRGMFAFALWDRRAHRLLLARDRLGIKPLYLRTEGGALGFASEVRALHEPHDVVDPASLASYLRFGWVAPPGTIYHGITELPPGHLMVWSDGRAERRRYWAPEIGGGARTTAAALTAQLHETLGDAVRRHLVADVPVGIFLSSGTDSAVVAALAAEAGSEVTAYTVTFDGAPDEGDAAAALAREVGLPHQRVPVSGSELLAGIGEVLAALDQPSVDGVNTWVVSRAVRSAGAVVALSGLGGDELVGGYSTFRHVPRIRGAGRVLAALPRDLRAGPGRWADGRAAGTSRIGRAAEAAGLGGWQPSYAAVRGLFTLAALRRLWPGGAEHVAGLDERSVPAPAPGHEVTRMELGSYLVGQLLRDTDVMSMAHSLEVRVPLLDDHVVRLLLAHPDGTDALRGKRLLSSAVGPAFVQRAGRPKMTFTLPFDRWLRGDLADRAGSAVAALAARTDCGFDRKAMLDVVDAHRRGRAGWRPVWALAVLGEWLDGGRR